MSSPPLCLEGLDQAIEALLLGSPIARGRRLLGVEYERLILHKETRESAPLEVCRQLFADLVEDLAATPDPDGDVLAKMNGGDFGMSMEPGGQLELATAPRQSLADLDHIVLRVTQAIDKRLAGTDYRMVCLGHAPVTPVAELGLLPRNRYHVMDAHMPGRGPLTRNMMRATAGFQLAYDVTDRQDAGRKLALLYRLTPVLMALCANSRMAEGKDTGYASYRHVVWWQTDGDRVGIPEGCLHADTAIDGYVRYARRARALFRLVDGKIEAAPQEPFEHWVRDGAVSLAELDLHLSSLFPFIRLRNYIEVRMFDAVEWPLVRSVCAMLSGILYCGLATERAEALSEPLAIEDLDAMREFHLAAARDGLDATDPAGRSLRDVARELVACAKGRLGDRDCNWARPEDLAEVARRIEGG